MEQTNLSKYILLHSEESYTATKKNVVILYVLV